MTEDDEALYQHYLARGAEPWNGSLEAAWLDFTLRAWAAPRLHGRVANIGIGVGLWDDWLGHQLDAEITSVDRDPTICRLFHLRQQREGHPHPARVVCGDIRSAVLPPDSFDTITIVGSTIAEAGRRATFDIAYYAWLSLRPGGHVLLADVGTEATVGTDVGRLGGRYRRLGNTSICFKIIGKRASRRRKPAAPTQLSAARADTDSDSERSTPALRRERSTRGSSPDAVRSSHGAEK